MIKAENGRIEAKGTTPELMTDLQCIIRALNEQPLKCVSQEEKKEMILNAVNDGLTPFEDVIEKYRQENNEIDKLLQSLGNVFENIAKSLKGSGEE